MNLKRRFSKELLVIAGIILVGFAVKFNLIFKPVGYLVSNILPDDAFYYFQIAKNVLAGFGSTFDGMNSANGYHPLWLLVILPAFAAFSSAGLGAVEPIRASLLIAAVFDVVTILAVLAVVSRFTERFSIKAGIAAFWAFNPFIIYEVLNGLETSLSLMLIAVFALCAVRADEKGRTKDYALAGIFGGLMMLARLDNLLFFVTFLGWIAYRRDEWLKRGLTTGLIATAIVLPWLVWNYAEFGMVLTTSGKAFTLVNHQLIVQDHGPGLLQQIKATFYSIYYEVLRILDQTGAPQAVLVVIGAALSWLAMRRDGSVVRKALRSPLAWLFFGLIAIFILNTGIRWSARTWYYISFNLFLAYGAAWLIDRAWNDIPKRRAVFCAGALAVTALFVVGWFRHIDGRMAAQEGMYETALWTNSGLPDRQSIGVFNAGIMGYFSKHRIVNLDGLVNTAAYEAMSDRRLWDYMNEEGVSYLADYDIYLSYRYRSFLGVEDLFGRLEVVRVESPAAGKSGSGFTVYRIAR